MPWELLAFVAACFATALIGSLAVDYVLDTIQRIRDGL